MKLIIGNLKMNINSKAERESYFRDFENCLTGKKFKEISFIVCPSFIHLEAFVEKMHSWGVSVGAQNINTESCGRFTGEVSAPMIKNFGGEYVIIGHSERRVCFNETDDLINEKVKIALKNNLIPIICIGETEAERAAGEIKNIILAQLLGGLKDVSRIKISQVVIVYEPIWAIGSGRIPTSDEIMEVRILMQKILSDKFGLTLEKMPKIIYGGSVNAKNIEEICIESGMQGALVGGESLCPKDFIKIGEVLENN